VTTIGSETEFINTLIGRFEPSPRRRNAPHEADAELIELFGGGLTGNTHLLAVTTDTISEEIETGLYRDPYQIGWMAVTASLSDLAAVGAAPLGLLISETLPEGYGSEAIEQLQEGISDGCRSARTHVLGGDTNTGQLLSITGTAIGLVYHRHRLTRRGCAPGDILYASGRLGRGNGFALAVFGNGRSGHFPGGYLPRARVREGLLLPGAATSCMDSSDGLFSTLAQLAALNRVGFRIAEAWEDALDRTSLEIVRSAGLPAWLLLAGCHGEFEQIFTVGESRRDSFTEKAGSIGWNPVEIGTVTEGPGVLLPVCGGTRNIDVAYLRNLSFRRSGGIGKYLDAILQYEHEMAKGE